MSQILHQSIHQRLQDSDPGVRRVAVIDLPYTDEEDDIAPLLVAALSDPDAAVRAEAAHALEGVQQPPAIFIDTADVILSDGQAAVRIRVENNGEPIPAERLQLIFKMFYTSKQAGRGTGLGLPVSRMLVQRYGGDLSVRSPVVPHEEPKYGACFEIVLRCKARPSADILKETGQQLLLIEKQLSEGN